MPDLICTAAAANPLLLIPDTKLPAPNKEQAIENWIKTVYKTLFQPVLLPNSQNFSANPLNRLRRFYFCNSEHHMFYFNKFMPLFSSSKQPTN